MPMHLHEKKTLDQTLSYLHCLMTGTAGKNWKQVTNMLESYAPNEFENVGVSYVPDIIPSPECLQG